MGAGQLAPVPPIRCAGIHCTGGGAGTAGGPGGAALAPGSAKSDLELRNAEDCEDCEVANICKMTWMNIEKGAKSFKLMMFILYPQGV